jgi:diadenosine tetraphosphate (Ap4A) HIT family hydrolase
MICPFCKIDEVKTRILKEGKYYFIVLSNPRLVAGHLLVIPKRHVEKLSQLSNEEKKEIFDAVIALEEKVLKRFASGCDIKTHYRPFMKQSWVKVNHLHFHLQPREFEDELYQKSQKYEKEIWKELTEMEMKKFTKLFGE